jgi:hypothetical protein
MHKRCTDAARAFVDRHATIIAFESVDQSMREYLEFKRTVIHKPLHKISHENYVARPL